MSCHLAYPKATTIPSSTPCGPRLMCAVSRMRAGERHGATLTVDSGVCDISDHPRVDAVLGQQAYGRIRGISSHDGDHADAHVERLVEIGPRDRAERADQPENRWW